MPTPPHPTTPPQLPLWILRQLQCPFQGVRYSPGKSDYYCPEMATRAGCPFGHRTAHSPQPSSPLTELSPSDAIPESGAPPSVLQAAPNTRGLVPIPAGVCIEHLIGRCNTQEGVNCGSAHLTLEELQQKCNLNVIIPLSPAPFSPPQGGATPRSPKKKRSKTPKIPKPPRSPKTPKRKKRAPRAGSQGAPPLIPITPVVTPGVTPRTATPSTQATTPDDDPTVNTEETSTSSPEMIPAEVEVNITNEAPPDSQAVCALSSPPKNPQTERDSMSPAEQPQPELFYPKKLAVFVLIGISAALIIMSTVIFLYEGFFASLCATRVGLLCERIVAGILLLVEAYLVCVDHYFGCSTFLMVNFLRTIWTIWLAYKSGAWHVWLIMPFDWLHVIAFVLFWFELNQIRIRDAASGQQPIKVVIPGECPFTSGSTTICTRSTGASATEASFLSV